MAFDKNQFKDLIERTLKEIRVSSPAAVSLLLGTAAKEFHFGTYLKQIDGPALGVFMMEPSTETDIWVNVLNGAKDLKNRIINATGQIGPNVRALHTNISYQICMCRAHYLRFPEPFPNGNNVRALGEYWKKYYNTAAGKGTIEDFIACWERFIGGRP